MQYEGASGIHSICRITDERTFKIGKRIFNILKNQEMIITGIRMQNVVYRITNNTIATIKNNIANTRNTHFII